jgi:hypothetical protein
VAFPETEDVMNLKSTYRFQDFVDAQRAGTVNGVFVDDSGSPGLGNTPSNLHPDRKTWVAVVVPKAQIAEVWSQFPRAIDELKRLTGGCEFHFADVYAGRREFKDLGIDRRLAIFAFMAHIFEIYKFPVIVQTLDPETLRDVRTRASLPQHVGPFNLTKHEDLALFFLLLRVKWHMEQNYLDADRLTRVFVDEGYKKNGAGIRIPPLARVFCDGLICFGRSDTILPLQLADFAAFCLNRTQLLLGKANLGDLDTKLLAIIQPLMYCCQNIPKIRAEDWFSSNPTKH